MHNPISGGRRVYGFLVVLAAGLGAAIAGRHVWLQSVPEEQVPSCGPGLNFILDNFPISQAIDMVLRGSGECADVLWTFLGLSIPAWTLVAFVVMILVGLNNYLADINNLTSSESDAPVSLRGEKLKRGDAMLGMAN
eukprot:CAMPEP_0184469660 /NCGR_PEP_ID=MMETSP0740-20130409/87085_1 /TAXON_ID=385413 /ORGANISM="Thalassiosira miniscula, Strain CCMP1093" /LENGTH=136 /DNA_ID=CAMNT_0026845625 /DNA_START=225 /DNA_END=636 /DNA_ORIENTATION=+